MEIEIVKYKLPGQVIGRIICCALFITCSVSLRAQGWAWGRIGNDGGNVTDVWGVAEDKKGNGFFAGSFPSNITFGAFTLTTQSSNAYLVKYDTAGNVLWARQSVVPSYYSAAFGSKVAGDTAGNSFITGWFKDTASFGPNVLKTPASPQLGYGTVFVAKYDALGTVEWARQGKVPGPNSYAFGNGICTDVAGNVYVSGYFTDTITFGAITLTHNSFSGNAFVVKYDAGGNVLWAIQSSPNSVYGNINALSVKTDSAGNVYITGPFQDSVKFGALQLNGNKFGTLTYIAKFDASGNPLWARQATAPDTWTSTNSGNDIITDEYGSTYLCGFYTDTIYFGATMFKVPNNSHGSFLAKYNAAGSLMWVKSSGTVTNTAWSGYSLAIDDCNQIYFTGGGGGAGASLIFNNDTITSSASGDDSYIIKIDTGGVVTGGSIIPSGGDDYNGVATDGTGRYVYLGGDMFTDMVLGKDSLTVGGFGGEQAFFARWLPPGSFCRVGIVPDTVDTATTPPVIEPCGKLFVPDAFSPNGDGQNDVFYVKDNCLTSFHLSIYDRWGNKVFESENVDAGWDGSYLNKPLNTGTFVYYLEGTDISGNAFSKKGSLALVK